MVLPIYLYGHPVLKQVANDIDQDYPDLPQLIQNMWDTMNFAKGVGLAAPQIGLSIRLFVVDTKPYYEDRKMDNHIQKVFINPIIDEEYGKEWNYEEGCLSIPGIHAEISRQTHVKITYFDAHFNQHTEVFNEMNARVIQHEYDHIEGVLFVDHLSNFRKQILQKKLGKIRRGLFEAKYPIKQ